MIKLCLFYSTKMGFEHQTLLQELIYGLPGRSHSVCGTCLCVRDLTYMPSTKYNFRSFGALRQLDVVHSKTNFIFFIPTILFFMISCIPTIIQKEFGKGKSQSQRIILIYHLHYSSLFPKQLRYLQLEIF